MTSFTLKGVSSDTGARRGELRLPHASLPIQTPVFMPVGTLGTVKAMTQEELSGLGFSLILGNTYHLYLRPGHELVRKAGGLHKFIAWDGAMLTDSGGFQVFSLQDLRKITENGAAFKSHIDGSEHFFSPERSIEVQHALGADIIMAFDECPPYPSTYEQTQSATERTHRWLTRCVAYHKEQASEQLLFGIAQGGTYESLRIESAQFIAAQDTPGIAIGGVSVGEPPEKMLEAVSWSMPYIPKEKPRYLMGVGTPQDILQAVAQGVDMFDCVLPTRLGRTGTFYTMRGRINIKGSRYTEDFGPVDPECSCAVCRRYSAAYLRHLYKCNEILASRLTTYHNLAHYAQLMADIRDAIERDDYASFMQTRLAQYGRKNDMKIEEVA
ncbi:queuine tRNA-ribosyltransferase [Capsulimonas corticalis]|uniref:Queuine tRNA-ribosyltransferase n=1 Tax=Capsulimonas corticalis TaxID=2219043 RepID=A0A402CSA8_9BACT|nr:tRNA guanosine(34) transglycosylase Tgt [Capsulimonas corticalis]BDI28308.1 queuine tRNA-ribosyltransferase [Capsulimonas corticalis]